MIKVYFLINEYYILYTISKLCVRCCNGYRMNKIYYKLYKKNTVELDYESLVNKITVENLKNELILW